MDKEEIKKNKSTVKIDYKKLIIAAIITAIILFIVVCGFKKIFGPKNPDKSKATYTNAFFIKNKKGKFALFNDKGKNLTGFIYENAGKILNNSAFVMKEDNVYAVIDNKGKEIIPEGKYTYLSDYNGFYKAKEKDSYILLSATGKEILRGKDLKINTYGSDYPFAVIGTNKSYFVYTIDGTKLYEFKVKKDAKSPTVNHINEFASVFYNGKTVILNIDKKKTISEIKEDVHYCINSVSDNKEIFTLNSCTSWFSGATIAEGHGIIYKGEFTNLTKKCNGFNVYDNTVVCVATDGAYFLNLSKKEVTVGINAGNKTAFIDGETYAKSTKDLKKVEFYKNGKKVNDVNGSLAVLGKVEGETYLINNNGKISFYNAKGKQISDKTYENVSPLDKNELAKVYDKSNYYLINKKGKVVSEKYKTISLTEEFYIVTDSSFKKGLLNSEGKEIIKPRYDSITISKVNGTYIAKLTTGTNFIYYNVDKEKEIIAGTGSSIITDHYIKIDGKSTEYYNLKGKLIYTDK